MANFDQLVDFYYHPELGYEKEIKEIGCENYRIAIITYTNPFTITTEYWVIFDGPGIENYIEHMFTMKKLDELIEDFITGVHKDRLCKCGLVAV